MNDRKVRFGVIGLGNIAQVAVLPAFAHASERCKLAALISHDEEKLTELRKEYEVEHVGSYDDLERVFREAAIDAAYIALPNTHHREYTQRCALAGIHVLCEKPMAMSSEDCEAMIEVCRDHDVKLMVAYRLHFDSANLEAVEIAHSGRIGELRYFTSAFSQQVREGDIRTRADVGGGALFDMGIYCVNAARYVFRDEPEEVFALQTKGHDRRFQGVDETTTAVLRFPGDRFAQFTTSQGAASVDAYRIVGTEGDLRIEPAYTYYGELTHYLTIGGETTTRTFPKSDQFAPELLHFAQCILDDVEPEPSGEEGLADVRILEALAESAQTGAPVKLAPFTRTRRPGRELAMRKPAVERPKVVHAPSPTK